MYLACSWTWCIGMFLPVLLVRDYGIWGYIAFAVPNIVGAAAMGWTLKTGASERIVREHPAALRAFSLITMAFQATFFIGMMQFSGVTHPAMISLLLLLLVHRQIPVRLIPAIWLVSLGLLITAWFTGGEVATKSTTIGTPVGLLFLAPVCIFGFLLCPYLDLTFHRARQALNPSSSRLAFTLGFGVFFAAMILGTLSYAALALPRLNAGDTPAALSWLTPTRLVVTHIAMQLLLTIALHRDELARLQANGKRVAFELVGTLVITLAICAIAHFATSLDFFRSSITISANEVVYRLFMAFYGLVFPAYVWICMIPTAGGHAGLRGTLGRRKVLTLALAITFAAPCYWMGFITMREEWLAIGLGLVLIARLFVRDNAKTNGRDQTAPTSANLPST